MKSAVVLALICGVAMACAGVAGAVPPVHHTDVADYHGSAPCSTTWNDVYVGHLDFSVISTYDKAGNPVKDIVHISGWETNYRSDMPSVTITARRNFTEIYTYATDSDRTVGNIFTQTAPGEGVLFHDVGFIMFEGGNVTIHGPHDIFNQGDAAFCNALLTVTP